MNKKDFLSTLHLLMDKFDNHEFESNFHEEEEGEQLDRFYKFCEDFKQK